MHRLAYRCALSGREVLLDGPGVWVGTACGLRSREWAYDLDWRGPVDVHRAAREVSLTADITNFAQADAMRRAFDADMASGVPGAFVFDGIWETRGYVSACEPKLVSRTLLRLDMTAVLIDGIWRRERKIEFLRQPESDADGLDYPYGYPYDYAAPAAASVVEGSLLGSPAKLVIYGPVSKPAVRIGGNLYQVDVDVPVGGYLVVDGLAKTIVLHRQSGVTVDAFAAGMRGDGAGRGSYVFERVPPGRNQVVRQGAFGFDLYLYDEEGEPPWTSY